MNCPYRKFTILDRSTGIKRVTAKLILLYNSSGSDPKFYAFDDTIQIVLKIGAKKASLILSLLFFGKVFLQIRNNLDCKSANGF